MQITDSTKNSVGKKCMMESMITARIIRNLCMLRPLRLTVDETGDISLTLCR